jgi:glycosyltransferase involved in cell wall biosynthesis
VTVNVEGAGQPRGEHAAAPSARPLPSFGAAELGELDELDPGARPCVLVPAFDAARSIASVVGDLRRELPDVPVLVVDDGSGDATGELAARAGAEVVAHGKNRGKGAALATGLATARARGFDVALTVDADGQHPAASARAVLHGARDRRALVLGVRDLARDGAPRANQLSNGISNYFLSRFTGVALADTQCGLRRYPVAETLALGARAEGYAFEAEVILRAVHAGIALVQAPVAVVYPPEKERVTHFDSVRDPARIIAVVLRTLREIHRG